jgi:ferredoxin-nitrite reductase
VHEQKLEGLSYIGLQGTLIKTPRGMVDAFDISVGGILRPGAQFNTTLKGKVKGDEVGFVLAQLLLFYKESRDKGESFHMFFNRVGTP